MDPQQTWSDLLSAWQNRDWQQVFDLSQALVDWLQREGFPPEVSYPKELGAECNRVIAKATCVFMLGRSQSVLADPNGIPQEVDFSLSCAQCNNEGPASHTQALEQNWQRIEYIPNSFSENFLGICPTCNSAD